MTNLADRYAALKAEIEGLNFLLDELKTEIKATGMAEITGGQAVVTVTLSEPTRFDANAAKAFLTPDQIASCTKTAATTSFWDGSRSAQQGAGGL